MLKKSSIAIIAAVSFFLCSGCPSPNDGGDGKGPSDGIEIGADAIFDSARATTDIIVSVWNQGYTSPIENAAVTVNGTALPYNSTYDNYSVEIGSIGPGSDIAFSVTCGETVYAKTIKMPPQIAITGWNSETGFDETVANDVEWSYVGDSPDKISLLIGDAEWFDIGGSAMSYSIPGGTFTGLEAFAYVGIRAVNAFADADGRKRFSAFTSDEGFRMY